MGGSKKKFIDKKKDVVHKYKIVNRSQRDPLTCESKAPQHVLMDIEEDEELSETQKYGVYFDDDYDYLKHLKGVVETVDWQDMDAGEVYYIRAPDAKKDLNKKGLTLPSSVFESYVEEPVGLLTKAAPVTGPQPRLDPDVVAQLDEAYEITEENEEGFDNLLSMLNKDTLDGTGYEPKDGSDDEEADVSSEISYPSYDGNFAMAPKSPRTNKSASGFTEFTHTSAHLPRSEAAQFFNERWEAFHLKHYSKDQIGALDEESTRGFLNAEEFFANMPTPKPRKGLIEDFPEDQEFNKKYIMQTEHLRKKPQKIVKERKFVAKYDIETYHQALAARKPRYVVVENPDDDDSNYKKVRLSKKALEKHNIAEEDKDDDSNSLMEMQTLKSALTLASIRPKGESKEERYCRKKSFKALQAQKRVEKKISKVAYKEMKKKHSAPAIRIRYRNL